VEAASSDAPVSQGGASTDATSNAQHVERSMKKYPISILVGAPGRSHNCSHDTAEARVLSQKLEAHASCNWHGSRARQVMGSVLPEVRRLALLTEAVMCSVHVLHHSPVLVWVTIAIPSLPVLDVEPAAATTDEETESENELEERDPFSRWRRKHAGKKKKLPESKSLTRKRPPENFHAEKEQDDGEVGAEEEVLLPPKKKKLRAGKKKRPQ